MAEQLHCVGVLTRGELGAQGDDLGVFAVSMASSLTVCVGHFFELLLLLLLLLQ